MTPALLALCAAAAVLLLAAVPTLPLWRPTVLRWAAYTAQIFDDLRRKEESWAEKLRRLDGGAT